MGKSQPTYTREFKQQAVILFKTSGKSKTQIARDLGISDSALSKWCKEFNECSEAVEVVGKPHVHLAYPCHKAEISKGKGECSMLGARQRRRELLPI